MWPLVLWHRLNYLISMNSCFSLLMHWRNWYIIIIHSKRISISLLPSPVHNPGASHTSVMTSLPTPTRGASLEGFLAVLSSYLALVDDSVISSLSSSCPSFSHPTTNPCILSTNIILMSESLAHSTHHMGVCIDPSLFTVFFLESL